MYLVAQKCILYGFEVEMMPAHLQCTRYRIMWCK